RTFGSRSPWADTLVGPYIGCISHHMVDHTNTSGPLWFARVVWADQSFRLVTGGRACAARWL
ncbi:MAG: hypothetical protein JXA10_18530, partial [Anaerolineae bacterium]|nr:hypothetical protein [Anaerolineae bacterium]